MQKLIMGCVIAFLFTACSKQLKEDLQANPRENSGIGVTPQIHILGYWEHRDFFSGASGFGKAEGVFELNGKAYIYGWGGLYNAGELWEYDDNTLTWTRKADLPGIYRTDVSTFSINGKGYLVGGLYVTTSNFRKELFQYDPITNTWTQKADFPGAARYNAASFAINGKGYYGIGAQYSQVYTDFYEYNPATNVWTQKASLPALGRMDAYSFAVAGKGYVGTGLYFNYSPPGWTIYLKDHWEYNPLTNSWTQKADYAGGTRIGCASFTLNDHGYVGTGYDPINDWYKKDFWVYHPSTNIWRDRWDYGGIARKNAIGFSVNGYGFIGFGETANGDGERALWRFTSFD